MTTDTTDQPNNVYYVLEDRTAAGYEKEDDQYGDARECLLLPFDKQSTSDPHGKNHYSAQSPTNAFWQECGPYAAIDKPPLVINSIPPEFADQMGIELPDLPFLR